MYGPNAMGIAEGGSINDEDSGGYIVEGREFSWYVMGLGPAGSLLLLDRGQIWVRSVEVAVAGPSFQTVLGTAIDFRPPHPL